MTTDTTTLDAVPTYASGSLRRQLTALGAAGATGRLAVLGVGGGWVHLQDGRIFCAERAGLPTLLVAMAEAGLFSPEEWAMALRLPFGSKWPALVGGDVERFGGLATFARTFVLEHVGALLDVADRHADVPTTFARGVAHPFGPLERWPVADVLAELPAPESGAASPTIDRSEFLELLEEVSPHVRRVGDGRLCFVDLEAPR